MSESYEQEPVQEQAPADESPNQSVTSEEAGSSTEVGQGAPAESTPADPAAAGEEQVPSIPAPEPEGESAPSANAAEDGGEQEEGTPPIH